MDDTNLQETAARADTTIAAKIDALSIEMKAGFERAFEQTQGGFDDFQAFAIFMRTETGEQFKQVDEQFKQVGEQFKQVDEQFKHVHRRFDGMEDRFDRIEKLIKER